MGSTIFSMHLHTDIVVGEAVHDSTPAAMLQKYGTYRPLIFIIERARKGAAQLQNTLATFMLFLRSDDMRNLQCLGSRALAV